MSVTSFTITSDTRLQNLSYIKGTFTMDTDYPSNGSTDFGYDVNAIDGGIIWFWGTERTNVYEIRFDPVHKTFKVFVSATGLEYTDDGSALDGLIVDFFALRSTFTP